MSSDSDLASTVASLFFGNYTSLVVVAAVVYDYVITLPNEINYVWNRPWSFVSAMFVIVRYVGLTTALTQSLFGTTFLPGPIEVSVSSASKQLVIEFRNGQVYAGTIVLLVSEGTFVLFLAAADIVMILRVYAMYNQSKRVLGVLLLFYVATIILFSVSAAYYNNPNTYMTMSIAQVDNMSFCNPSYIIVSQLGKYKYIPRYSLAGLLFILAVSKLCLDSIQSYRVSKEWKTNQYVNLLVREGILYFVAHIFYIVDFGQDTFGIIMATISYIAMIVLSPRFIMSVRALYVSNMHSANRGIDTGFGLKWTSSRGTPGTSSVGFTERMWTHDLSEGDTEMQTIKRTARSMR